MVTETSAKEIAVSFVREHLGYNLRLLSCQLFDRERLLKLSRLAGCPNGPLSEFGLREHWSVQFEMKLADGSIMDEPATVSVDIEDGKAKFER